MNVTLNIPATTITNLMISAIEGGDPVTNARKGGWCDGIYCPAKGTLPPEGANGEPWYAVAETYEAADFRMEVVEVDDEATGHTTSHVIDRAKLIAGLALMATKFPSYFAQLLEDNTDAPCADVFLQSVCFGEERYA